MVPSDGDKVAGRNDGNNEATSAVTGESSIKIMYQGDHGKNPLISGVAKEGNVVMETNDGRIISNNMEAGNVERNMGHSMDDVEENVDVDYGDGKRKRVGLSITTQYLTPTQDKGCSLEDGPYPQNADPAGSAGQAY